jgi:hypothetical protein
MFDLKFLNSFREYKEGENVEIDSKLRNAWYSFISEFCRSVSYHWKRYLGKIGNRESATFDGNLSTSDEAFAMWVVHCKYDDAKKEAEEIKKMGLDKWKETREKNRHGPHDSKTNLRQYVEYYGTVKKFRKDQKADEVWQDMFFEDFFKDPVRASSLSCLDQDKKNLNGGAEKESDFVGLPGMDDDASCEGNKDRYSDNAL